MGGLCPEAGKIASAYIQVKLDVKSEFAGGDQT